jgi:DNA-binding CsgD family transcriptional regulator
MNLRFIILHSSEIVRTGLESIIRKHFQIDIIEGSEMSFLHHHNLKNECLIVLAEDSFLSNKKLENLLLTICKKFELIKISRDDSITDNSNHISLRTGSSQLINIIKVMVDGFNGSEKNEHEGEELTLREQEVLKLVAVGFPNKIIADKLFISIHTVISHRKNITEKLGIKSISGLTVYAVVNGLIDTSKINVEDLF